MDPSLFITVFVELAGISEFIDSASSSRKPRLFKLFVNKQWLLRKALFTRNVFHTVLKCVEWIPMVMFLRDIKIRQKDQRCRWQKTVRQRYVQT